MRLFGAFLARKLVVFVNRHMGAWIIRPFG
jgi:hypothetical protein